MFDFHMHTMVSFDGRATAQQMLQAAEKVGMKEICFTDHIDEDPKGIALDQCFSIDAYANAYDTLKSKTVKIRRGAEFGMLPNNRTTIRSYLSRREFDFILGSVHYADNEDVYFPPYWEGKTVFEAERKYLEDTYTCVCVHDDFDVLGHLTYLSKAQSHPTHAAIRYEDHRELVDEILRTLVQKGKGMEINSSGVDVCGDFLPGATYLHRFKELGGQIVTMGSDAHAPDRVGQHADRACAILKEIFGYVCTFEERKPIFHKL